MPITDLDLIQIARTAKNLREIHITRTTMVTLGRGVRALIEASQASLQLVEYSPLSESECSQEIPIPPLLLNRQLIETFVSGNSSANHEFGRVFSILRLPRSS